MDHQSRPGVRAKDIACDRLIRLTERDPDWVLDLQDEVWWRRLTRSALPAWAGDEPARLHEPPADASGREPKAPGCYGRLRFDTGGFCLRFVDGRPVGRATEDFLAWACERLAAEGKRALLLIWDNAAEHVCRRVRAWIKAHNRRARAEGRVRIVACYLPVKAPWFDAIEPKRVHGKRAIVDPGRQLTGDEAIQRACGHCGCEPLERVNQHVA